MFSFPHVDSDLDTSFKKLRTAQIEGCIWKTPTHYPSDIKHFMQSLSSFLNIFSGDSTFIPCSYKLVFTFL